MSDDRELSPEQEERVRRLLVEARVGEPIPGDVAGRLDRVLARLADGEPEREPAEVVELASRRRRRVTTVLVAAAAAVAVGVGAGMLGPDEVSPTADGTASVTAPEPADRSLTDSDVAGGAEEAAPAEGPAEGPPSVVGGKGGRSSYVLRAAAPTRIRPDFFAVDVERVRTGVAALSSSTDAQAPDQGLTRDLAEAAQADLCEPGAWGPGELFLVRYDGNPAVLAFRPPVGDTQVADLLQCGSAEILRSVTLPGG